MAVASLTMAMVDPPGPEPVPELAVASVRCREAAEVAAPVEAVVAPAAPESALEVLEVKAVVAPESALEVAVVVALEVPWLKAVVALEVPWLKKAVEEQVHGGASRRVELKRVAAAP